MDFNKKSNLFSNEIINLILIVNINTGNVDKIFYSFCNISCLTVVGDNDDIIIAGRDDGIIDIFDMKPLNEKYYLNFENLNKNLLFYGEDSDLNPEFQLKLSSFSSTNLHQSKIVKIKKKKIDKNSYKIFSLDTEGKIVIWELIDKDIKDFYKLEISPLKKTKEIEIDKLIQNSQKYKCIDFDLIQNANISSKDTLYILTNAGLLKLTIDLSDQHYIHFIHCNDKESSIITAFSVSDNGYLLCSYNDSSIK